MSIDEAEPFGASCSQKSCESVLQYRRVIRDRCGLDLYV